MIRVILLKLQCHISCRLFSLFCHIAMNDCDMFLLNGNRHRIENRTTYLEKITLFMWIFNWRCPLFIFFSEWRWLSHHYHWDRWLSSSFDLKWKEIKDSSAAWSILHTRFEGMASHFQVVFLSRMFAYKKNHSGKNYRTNNRNFNILITPQPRANMAEICTMLIFHIWHQETFQMNKTFRWYLKHILFHLHLEIKNS